MKKLFSSFLTLTLCLSLFSQSQAELGVGAIGLVVSDIKASEHFYNDVLGFMEAGEFSLDQQWSQEAGAANDKPFSVKMFKQNDKPSATVLKLAYFEETPKQPNLDGINSRSGVNYITFYYDAENFKKILQNLENAGLKKTGWVKRENYQLFFVKDPDGVYVEIIGPPDN